MASSRVNVVGQCVDGFRAWCIHVLLMHVVCHSGEMYATV